MADPYQSATPAGQGSVPAPQQDTRLPVVSLVFGLLSLVQCLPLIGGIVAIITGVMGRRRAKEIGQSTGTATAGLWLGIIGIVINAIIFIVLVATGFAIFGVVSTQAKIAEQLKPAQVAAEAYGAANGTYRGITLDGLARYGYVPVDDVTVRPMAASGGNSFCIEGALVGEPDTMIHVPPTAGEFTIDLNLGGSTYRYATGACPAG